MLAGFAWIVFRSTSFTLFILVHFHCMKISIYLSSKLHKTDLSETHKNLFISGTHVVYLTSKLSFSCSVCTLSALVSFLCKTNIFHFGALCASHCWSIPTHSGPAQVNCESGGAKIAPLRKSLALFLILYSLLTSAKHEGGEE